MFQSLFDLEIAIEIRQVHTSFTKLHITLLFWHIAIKFLDSNFLYISKVLALFTTYYILSLAKAK